MNSVLSVNPPESRKEFFDRLVEISQHGFYTMPQGKYSGTGAPGRFLEDLLGLRTGNMDIPDALGWELKYYTDKTNLVTLFHKEPEPKGIVRRLVSNHGWKDKHGRLSFRHTIAGRSDRFRVSADAGQLTVRPLEGNGPVPYWTEDVILNMAGGKLRRLVLVKGTRSGNKVRYFRIDVYENMLLTEFIEEVVNGTVKVDFDAREDRPGSRALRNHGTKFRVAPKDICRLYGKRDRIS